MLAQTASWPLVDGCCVPLDIILYVPTAVRLSVVGHDRVECTLHACILVGNDDSWRSVVAGCHKML